MGTGFIGRARVVAAAGLCRLAACSARVPGAGEAGGARKAHSEPREAQKKAALCRETPCLAHSRAYHARRFARRRPLSAWLCAEAFLQTATLLFGRFAARPT